MAGKKEKVDCDGAPSRLVQMMMGPSSSHQLLNDKVCFFLWDENRIAYNYMVPLFHMAHQTHLSDTLCLGCSRSD